MTDNTIKMKKCPFCAEDIRFEAIKCRYCHEFLNETSEMNKSSKQETNTSKEIEETETIKVINEDASFTTGEIHSAASYDVTDAAVEESSLKQKEWIYIGQDDSGFAVYLDPEAILQTSGSVVITLKIIPGNMHVLKSLLQFLRMDFKRFAYCELHWNFSLAPPNNMNSKSVLNLGALSTIETDVLLKDEDGNNLNTLVEGSNLANDLLNMFEPSFGMAYKVRKTVEDILNGNFEKRVTEFNNESVHFSESTTEPFVEPAKKNDIDKGDVMPSLASRWKRLAGALIDGLIIAIPFFIMFMLISSQELQQRLINGENMTMGEKAGFAVIGWLEFMMLNGYLLLKRGQTIGKVVVKTKIVDLSGNLPEFGSLFFYRYVLLGLIGLIPFIGTLVNFINPLCIFGHEKRCLHDYIAGTRVVEVEYI